MNNLNIRISNTSNSSSSNIKAPAHLSVVEPEKKLAELTDNELIRACQQRRSGAIDLLLKRYHPLLSAMVRRRFPELSDISDVVQEAEIRVWRSIEKLRCGAAFKGWLNQIVTNLCYDELRRKVRDRDTLSLDETFESEDGTKLERYIADTSTQPDTDLHEKELSQALAEALGKIPHSFTEPILLREVEGLSYEEIAVVTNTELGTVKSRISRARTKIQHHMAKFLEDAA